VLRTGNGGAVPGYAGGNRPDRYGLVKWDGSDLHWAQWEDGDAHSYDRDSPWLTGRVHHARTGQQVEPGTDIYAASAADLHAHPNVVFAVPLSVLDELGIPYVVEAY
jgi:hypothetical protein